MTAKQAALGLQNILDTLNTLKEARKVLSDYKTREILIPRVISAVNIAYRSESYSSKYMVAKNKNQFGSWYEWAINAAPNNYSTVYIEDNGNVSVYSKERGDRPPLLLTIFPEFLALNNEEVCKLLDEATQKQKESCVEAAKRQLEWDKQQYEKLKAKFECQL